MQASKIPLSGPVLDDDVVISRQRSDWTTGTRRYFDLVTQYFNEYSSLETRHHPRKREIVAHIISELSARFVTKKDKEGGWIILNEEEAIQKILQRFNDVTKRKKKEAAEAAAEEAAKLKEAAEREAAEEEEARIAAEEESDFDAPIDVEALLKSPINGVLDAQLSPPNNMAEATIGVNDAAASRADHMVSPFSVTTLVSMPNNMADTTIGVNEASGESYERLPAPMASLLALPNLNSLAQGRGSALASRNGSYEYHWRPLCSGA